LGLTTSSWVESSPNKTKTTSSISISGQSNVYTDAIGSDVYFYVSGTSGLSSSLAKKSVFGSDVQLSSSLHVDKNVSFKYVDLGNKGPASPVFDLRLGQKFRAVLTASLTASFIDPPDACNFIIKFVQDPTGSRTVKLPPNFRIMTGSTFSLSTSGSAQDLMSGYFDGEPSPTYYVQMGLGWVTIP
jgi:hypothetical protein